MYIKQITLQWLDQLTLDDLNFTCKNDGLCRFKEKKTQINLAVLSGFLALLRVLIIKQNIKQTKKKKSENPNGDWCV